MRIRSQHRDSATRWILPVLLALAPTVALHAASEAPGESADACRGVPTAPTEAHQASADPYATWMREWLALDWGQLCRYAAENAVLPRSSGRRVVMIGDSITEGWKSAMPEFFQGDVLDRGISGQTSGQMLLRFRQDVVELHPAVVHIMAGTNDVAGNTGPYAPDRVLANLQSMVELAHAHGIRVILAAVPPADHISWRPGLRPAMAIDPLNRRLEAYAHQAGVDWVDYAAAIGDGRGGIRAGFSDDGVHPSARGYNAMAPLARAAFDRALAENPPPR